VNLRLNALFLSGALFALAAPMAGAQTTNGNGTTYIMPDFRPWWSPSSIGDIRFDVGRSNDRLVDCDDWTSVGAVPTGMAVLSFTLSSPNFGAGDLRLRRQPMPDGSIEMYQTVSQLNPDGTCSALELDVPVAVIPSGPFQDAARSPLLIGHSTDLKVGCNGSADISMS